MSTEVFGRPITGDINKGYDSRVEQFPNEDFLPLLDAVLNAGGIDKVRWHQYTPSFNDGDPCTFTLGEFEVWLTDTDEDSEEGDSEDGWVSEYYISDYVDTVNPSTRGYERTGKPGLEDAFPALGALGNKARHFAVFLEDTFGNGSQIVATPAGFEVEYYDNGY